MQSDRTEGSIQLLLVNGPDGSERTIVLEEERSNVSIGRYDNNDIALVPDPQKNVSRRHCTLERDRDGYWWVTDKASANGTFVRQGNEEPLEVQMQKNEQVRLKHGDVIEILGEVSESEKLNFWKLQFQDRSPDATNAPPRIDAMPPPAPECLEYSLGQQSLFSVAGQKRTEIKLSPQESKMVHYMASRNRDRDGEPVLCKHQELIKAIWEGEDAFNHRREEINHLVHRIRPKIEPDPGNPRFLKTAPGRGYRLEIRVV